MTSLSETLLPVPIETIDPTSPPWNKNTRRIFAAIFVVGTVLLLWKFQGLLAQVIIAWLVAYLLNPVINTLIRHLHVKRGFATLMIYLVLLVALLALMGLTGVALVNQVTSFVNSLPALLSQAVKYIGNLTDNPNAVLRIGPFVLPLTGVDWSGIADQLPSLINPALSGGGTAAGSVASSVIGVLAWSALTFIISIYIAIDLPRFGRDFDEIALRSGYASDFEHLRTGLMKIGNAYLRGQLILGLAVGLVTWILLAILGVENALALGVLAGLLELIPYFGPVISGIVSVLVAFFQVSNHFGLGQVPFALATAGVMILVQQLEGNFLVPRVIGSALNLKPLTVVLALIVGSVLIGFLGIMLAGPLAAATRLVGGYLWRKMLGLPPWPPEEAKATTSSGGPSLLGATLGRIRSRIHREDLNIDEGVAEAGTSEVAPESEGGGEPPEAAKH